jgi:hypothetical protein
LLQTQSPGSLGHSASKPRAQCLAAVIPETITATTMATKTTETTATTMATKTTETTATMATERDGGDHSGDELARTATVVMHDLLGDKTVPPEQASDYFDVVREFYSGIPDAIILKLGGDASTLDHCVFILPAADYDSTGHLRVSPHARAITELFQDGTAHSCSCSEYRLARKGTCVHTVFAQRLRDLTQRAYVSFSNIVRTVNATRRMYESIGAHTSVQDQHTAVRNALGAAMGISVAYAQRGLKASGLPTFTVYCVMDFLSPTIPLSVNVSIAKLEATDKLIDFLKTTSSLSASATSPQTAAHGLGPPLAPAPSAPPMWRPSSLASLPTSLHRTLTPSPAQPPPHHHSLLPPPLLLLLLLLLYLWSPRLLLLLRRPSWVLQAILLIFARSIDRLRNVPERMALAAARRIAAAATADADTPVSAAVAPVAEAAAASLPSLQLYVGIEDCFSVACQSSLCSASGCAHSTWVASNISRDALAALRDLSQGFELCACRRGAPLAGPRCSPSTCAAPPTYPQRHGLPPVTNIRPFLVRQVGSPVHLQPMRREASRHFLHAFSTRKTMVKTRGLLAAATTSQWTGLWTWFSWSA